MVTLEKQLASENLSVDVEDFDLDTHVADDVDRNLQVEEENHNQQAKKIVEVDNDIAEKEEILTKLLDTVRGYSAMKVEIMSSSSNMIFLISVDSAFL